MILLMTEWCILTLLAEVWGCSCRSMDHLIRKLKCEIVVQMLLQRTRVTRS